MNDITLIIKQYLPYLIIYIAFYPIAHKLKEYLGKSE